MNIKRNFEKKTIFYHIFQSKVQTRYTYTDSYRLLAKWPHKGINWSHKKLTASWGIGSVGMTIIVKLVYIGGQCIVYNS